MLSKRVTPLLAFGLLCAGCGGGGSLAPSQPTVAPTPTTRAAPSVTPTPTTAPVPSPSQSGYPAPSQAPASAQPTPTVTPTAVPGPNTLTLTPDSLQLTAPSQTMNVTASQESFTGAYTVTAMTCGASIATISPASTTSGVFTVTERGAGGPCTFTLQGSSGVSAQLTVEAASTSGTISLRHRAAGENGK